MIIQLKYDVNWKTEGKDMISFYHMPSAVLHFNRYLSNT